MAVADKQGPLLFSCWTEDLDLATHSNANKSILTLIPFRGPVLNEFSYLQYLNNTEVQHGIS